MRKLIIIFAVLIAKPSLSQLPFQDYKRSYAQAIQLYANSRYENAIQAFLPLTSEKYSHKMVPYSHYYVALCSNNISNFTQSKNILKQLFNRFPYWEKTEEAQFLYAEALFNEKNYFEALSYTSKIQNKNIIQEIDNMEFKYLSEIKSLKLLMELNKNYPNNKTIAELLVKAINKKMLATKDELVLSDELTNRFNLVVKKKIGFRRVYDDNATDFGILLPFEINQVNVNQNKSYVYDIYLGLKMASEQLKNEGLTTNIMAFDIGNENEKMQTLINDKNFKNIDVFIGPLYPKPNELATEYAQKYKILQVHPLSNNSLLTKETSGVFLAQPSYEDQSNRALNFSKSLSSKKTISIYFGSSKKDSLFAAIYGRQAIKNGFSIIENKQFISTNDINLLDNNHIFLAAMPDEIEEMIRGIQRKKSNVTIVSPASSFTFSASQKSLISKNVYIIYPEYLNQSNQEVLNFKDLYINKMGESPTFYAYLGYDIGLYFSRILKYGKDEMRNQMNLIEYTKGYTLSGFDYTNNKNSNQLIPIVIYEDGEFKELTR